TVACERLAGGRRARVVCGRLDYCRREGAVNLPTVNFCGLTVTRLILGANPFGGFSHQNPARDREMVAYHTVDRIIETWGRAEAAGINTMITNNESPHVVQAVREYLGGGGKLQWIAQVNRRIQPEMEKALDEAVE